MLGVMFRVVVLESGKVRPAGEAKRRGREERQRGVQ